jgi:hypothetical protein
MDGMTFQQKTRRAAAGWYASRDDEDRALARMASVREETVRLLRSTGREGAERMLRYLDDSGFYWRPSSDRGHHNWPGGLAEHSLGTCRLALMLAGDRLPRGSVVIAAMLHDVCKADRFRFSGRNILRNRQDDTRHSARSIALIRECGIALTESERLAVRWHMKEAGAHFRDQDREADHARAVKDPLWHVVFWADKIDAMAHPAKRRTGIR